MDKKQYWPFLLVIPLIAAAAAGWSVLPDELVMQIGVDGRPSRVMAKPFGLLIPVALGWSGRASPRTWTGRKSCLASSCSRQRRSSRSSTLPGTFDLL